MEPLAIAGFLSVVSNRLVEALIVPIFVKLQLDKFWLLYVAWVVAGAIVAVSGINLFSAYIPDESAGRILTIIVTGGGSNLIADLFAKKS